jgi:competence protein ComEA
MAKVRQGVMRAGVTLLLGVTVAVGCARPHETEDEKVQRQAAEDTRQIRHDAQNAGVEAQKAAEQARRQAKDIIAGVRQGWQEGAPKGSHDRLDLNTASVADLTSLPGINEATAKRIVHHRPYASASELVKRGILTDAQYDHISDRVDAH